MHDATVAVCTSACVRRKTRWLGSGTLGVACVVPVRSVGEAFRTCAPGVREAVFTLLEGKDRTVSLAGGLGGRLKSGARPGLNPFMAVLPEAVGSGVAMGLRQS